jgi:non-heme chloroperoxidase
MPYFTTSDGTELYYTDQGVGSPVMLSHGWPLSSDAWQREIKLIADAGFRAIAHDRRGHGRSSKTYTGNDIDTYARDLAELIEHLDLTDLALVGHSTGGGEVVRYAARHGAGRVKRIFTVSAVPPVMLRSDSNPDGIPIEVFDGIRQALLDDAAQFYLDLAVPYFGADRVGAAVSKGMRDDFWRQAMSVDLAASYDCVTAISQSDFTDDLMALDVPVFIAQGDDDQLVPVAGAAEKAITLVRHGTLKVYPGAPHGIVGDYRKALDADILAFLTD